MSQGAETQRARRARLANLRQELVAPVSAILGFAEMLHQDAARNGPEEAVADLARILTAAGDLHAMVDRLLDKELAESLFEGADEAAAQQKLRHDLRTPINAIKGYSEMLLEDLEDLGAERMRADFDILLDQVDQLLSQIDTIVDAAGIETDDLHAGLPGYSGHIGLDHRGLFSISSQ